MGNNIRNRLRMGEATPGRWQVVAGAVLAVFLLGGIAGLMSLPPDNSREKKSPSAESHESAAHSPLPNPQVEAVTISRDVEEQLQAYLASWIQTHPNQEWGVYVEGIDGDFRAGVNANALFELASIYKLFLVAPLAEHLPSTQWGTPFFEGQTYEECVHRMISVSDNPCPRRIVEVIGWRAIAQWAQGQGFVGTDFANSEYFRGSAYDTAMLLKRLYLGEGYDGLTRRIFLDALADQQLTDGIPTGCRGCMVWSKTGNLDGHKHDAAIIRSRNVTYAVSIMSRNGTWDHIAELTAGINSIITQ